MLEEVAPGIRLLHDICCLLGFMPENDRWWNLNFLSQSTIQFFSSQVKRIG
jgi:hypothetical protein